MIMDLSKKIGKLGFSVLWIYLGDGLVENVLDRVVVWEIGLLGVFGGDVGFIVLHF